LLGAEPEVRIHLPPAESPVVIPETAPWLAEYLHEMTVFPKGKHDDQVDSTAQFLDWLKRPFPGQGFYELTRMRAEAITQRTRRQPVKPNWAPGSMEWQAEQEKAKQSGVPDADRGT
jgi:hypothetical protein